MRLIVIPISHYCERARWALDWAGLEYTEERHLQMFHLRAVKRAGGRHTVPVLVNDSGENLYDSGDIVAFADRRGERRLYPDEDSLRSEVQKLESELAGDFGVETRRLAYFELMPRTDLLVRYNNQGAPRYQIWGLRLGMPFARRKITRYLGVTAEKVAAGRAVIDDVFARIADLLSDGRPFLFGDSFTAADLTFASLAVPLILPPEYPLAMPGLDELNPSTRDIVEHYRAQPAGELAMRLYRDHRR